MRATTASKDTLQKFTGLIWRCCRQRKTDKQRSREAHQHRRRQFPTKTKMICHFENEERN